MAVDHTDPYVVALALEGYRVRKNLDDSWLIVTCDKGGYFVADMDEVRYLHARDWQGVQWWNVGAYDLS